jgi:dUTP pyrophosphatase
MSKFDLSAYAASLRDPCKSYTPRPVLKLKRARDNSVLLPLPAYETPGAAGMDLRADMSMDGELPKGSLSIGPGSRALIRTGLIAEVPRGYELQVRPRSGLALKHGVTVLNTPGCVDSDYRGEIGVIVVNHGQVVVEVFHGDRIAQAMIIKVERVEIVEVQELSTTERGAGGFGSTGVK